MLCNSVASIEIAQGAGFTPSCAGFPKNSEAVVHWIVVACLDNRKAWIHNFLLSRDHLPAVAGVISGVQLTRRPNVVLPPLILATNKRQSCLIRAYQK